MTTNTHADLDTNVLVDQSRSLVDALLREHLAQPSSGAGAGAG
jgi:hypothetical protein